jgi:hypothetical protein
MRFVMAYTLEQFAADCRSALKSDPGRRGREQVRGYLQQALRDAEFLVEYVGPDATSERYFLYDDPDLGFCICAHVYCDAKRG